MTIKELNRVYPFRKLFILLLAVSVILQFAVISYNHFSGYIHIDDFREFLIRWLYGTILTVPASLLLAYPDVFIISLLNRKLQWTSGVFLRVLVEFAFAITIGILVSVIVTSLANLISQYEESLSGVFISNALIASVINILLIIVLEALIFFKESRLARQEAETLERELDRIRFEVLKSQINPHFMFNSLNVLSGLIDSKNSRAQRFIEEFSMIYRYVLETIEKPVVTLKDELEFVRSYIFLQQMRYGKHLILDVSVDSGLLALNLPPLSLQTVLENAIKHNIVDRDKPLRIEISGGDDLLLIKNNIQPKFSSGYSSRLGQKNMMRRYSLISERLPEFIVETDHYVVRLPLIESI